MGLAKLLSSYTLKMTINVASWTSQEVDRLLDDLAVAKDKHHDYFLGTIVTTLAYMIFVAQQRNIYYMIKSIKHKF